MDEVEFAAGECLYAEGDLSDAFFIVKEGDVRLQIHSLEVDTDPVLDYVGAGSFIGHDSVLAGLQRWMSAYAETDVLASKVSSAGMRRMLDEDPEQGIAMLRALGRDTALKFRSVSQRLGEHLVSDFPDPEVERMVGAAVAAQKSFEDWPEERVDALLKDMAEAVAMQAEGLARATVEETTIGVVEDKILKIQFASLGVFGSIAGERANGPVRSSDASKVTEIASPDGGRVRPGPGHESRADVHQQDPDLPQGPQLRDPQLPPHVAGRGGAGRNDRAGSARAALGPARSRAVGARTHEPPANP